MCSHTSSIPLVFHVWQAYLFFLLMSVKFLLHFANSSHLAALFVLNVITLHYGTVMDQNVTVTSHITIM